MLSKSSIYEEGNANDRTFQNYFAMFCASDFSFNKAVNLHTI